MKTKRFVFAVLSVITILATITACATPTAQVVEKEVTKIVQEVVKETVVVEGKEVEVTKVVEKVVTQVVKEEVVVTATPDPSKVKPAVFNAAYPYSVPPQGHFNFFASGFLGVGIYQDLAELPAFFYKWATGEYIPLLGTDYAVEPPDKVRVTLRKGVKWSDGSDFTAKDMVDTFTIGRLQNYQVWNYVSKVEAIDDFTVLFTMGKPALPAVRMILKQRIAPSSVYGQFAADAQKLFDAGKTRDDQEWKDLQTKLTEFRPAQKVVTGPYTIASLDDVNEARLTMVKVPTSFWADKVKFDQILMYQGETPVITPLVMANQVDYATHGFAPATERAFKEMGIRILRPPIFSGPAIIFNFKIHPFELPEFRKAVAHAINMDDNAFVSLGESAKNQIYMTGVSENIIGTWLTQAQLDEMDKYEYNTAKAEEYLKGIGFTKGADGIWVDDQGVKCEYELIVPAEYADWSGAAENAAAQLTKFGIKTTMRGVTYTQIGDQVNKGDFQMAIQGWGSADPHPYFSIRAGFFNNNPAAISGGDPALPGIAYALQRTLADGSEVDLEQMIIDCIEGLDLDAQKGRVYDLVKIFNQELPRVPLWERYGNNPIQDGLNTTGWPADDDPLFKNSPYNDSFVILWILDGTVGPIE
ncbi:MAG: ABC transporter substrate-binding protein [Anaerolineae bacterium]|nr:ABC transporter substrate-binding protein [Anaerolineae bacterium]